MSDLKALVQRFNDEVFNKGDVAALDELVDDDFIEHEEFPGIPPDKAGLAMFVTALRAAFPDAVFDVKAMVTEGDEVWVQTITRGTHQGEFMGIPATGRQVEVQAIDRVRLRDDKIIEHWGVMDSMGMMQQLGVGPGAP